MHPTLVNGRTGDPAVYLETMFEKRAALFDLGDIAVLSPRKLQRIAQVFVSHAHIDHFVGFDRLLRTLVGRDQAIDLYGPVGFIGHVRHKLHGYRWDLVDRYKSDLIFIVTEIGAARETSTARFRLKNGFAGEPIGRGRIADGVVHSEPAFRVSTAVLEHRTACLAFAIEEAAHVNIWKSRLMERGLAVGPWLRDLKRAVIENRSDDYPVSVGPGPAESRPAFRLGQLRDVVTVTPGQKIGYVTDVADTPANRNAIVELVQGADLLLIEAAFADVDAALAADRAHLTTTAAGRIARAAGVRRIEPFHFSPRYAGEEERMLNEVMAAFGGSQQGASL
jgi:ribonuclease Z